MSRWSAAVALHYPTMAKALETIGEAIGNRPVDVFDVMVEAAEVERLRAVVRASFADAREAVDVYLDSPAGRTEATELAVRLTLALMGCVQLGVWLGEGRAATLDPHRVRRHLAALDKEKP